MSLQPSFLKTPLLPQIKVNINCYASSEKYPFSLSIIQQLKDIELPTQVTFFVGENGSGKSTLLEAIAYKAGFGMEGGSKNISFKTSHDHVYDGVKKFADCLTLSWRQKPKDGYFFRAESFYNVGNYLDYLERECGGNAYGPYGGKSLHNQSHGESFLAFFKNRVRRGLFILDEPEAALSPQRQLALLSIINRLCKDINAQFIIVTHSPILLAYPDATIYSCDGQMLKTIDYANTDHYQITKQFINNPELYLRYLFDDCEN